MPTLTLQPDGTAGLDTFTNEASADTSNATATALEFRASAGVRRFALIFFNLSSLPAGANITSAILEVWAGGTMPSADGLIGTWARVLPANSAWTEAGATWNYAVASTTRWAGDTAANGGTDGGCSVSGTDYSSTDMGTFNIGNGDAAGTKYTISLNLAEFSAMVAANHGLHLRLNITATTAAIRSSDAATAGERPRLTVEYTLPTVTGNMMLSRRRRFGRRGAL